MERAPGIVYVEHALFGRIELWAVNLDVSREGMGEPAFAALFAAPAAAWCMSALLAVRRWRARSR